MNIAEISIKKKVITLFIVMLIVVGGFFAFENLGRLEDPAFTIKEAQVITPYPGASAKQVEEEVSDRVETAIQQLPQLKRVTSLSKTGMSIVTAEIKDSYDAKTLPQVWDELRRKINDIQTQLPPGAGPSIVYDDFGDVYGILFALTAKGYSYKELEEYADFLRRELLLVPDVAKVNIEGVQPQEVHIEISRERLAQLGISPEQIFKTLEKQNLVVPSGKVRVGTEYIRINPTGDFTSVKQIGDLLIKGSSAKTSSLPKEFAGITRASGDRLIYLKDIATITRGYKTPPDLLIRHKGENTLVLSISITQGGNVVTMGEAVKKRLKELEPLSPVGMKVNIISFQSDFVTSAINSFIISLLEALAIVIAVLMIFMGLRSSLIISSALLLTIFGTFVGMLMWGINLERISLGALIIALGMLVDNAIVINDGILVRIEQGMERIAAAKKVVKQSAIPLLGATIIAILAFAAIGLSQDSTGEYTRSLFAVILISLTLSWVIAVTVTPLLCVMFIKAKKIEAGATAEEMDPYGGKFYGIYRRFLTGCIRARWLTMSILLGLLAIGIYGFSILENSFFPESNRPQFMVHFWLPQGTDIRETSDKVKKIEKYIENLKPVTSVTSFIGRGAPRFLLTYSPEKAYTSYAFLLVNIKDYRDINKLMPQIQKYAKNNFPNAMVKQRKFVLGPGKEDSIEVRFSGPDPNELRKLANKAKAIMLADGGLDGIKDNWRERVKIVRPLLSETQARAAGISKNDLDEILQMTYNGLNVGIYREYDKLLPIIVQSPKGERSDINNIKDIQIWSPLAGRTIPIRQIVSGFKTSWEDSVIQRRNRKQTVTAQASQKSGNASIVFNRIRPKIDAIPLPKAYEREWGGEYEDAGDAQKALFSKIPVVIILVILLLVMLFNSLKQPLIIMLTVPLAVIGVSIGLLVTGQSFGFMALLGFLSLAGMLIKNSIVLIDQIDLEIEEGKARFQAILDSSVSRLRPVSMAAVTTVLGMIPLVFDIFFISMAVTIMAGLTFATLLTLIVVPVLYAILFNITHRDKDQNKNQSKKQSKKQSGEQDVRG